jgi:pSer/pThr/pTyr-binding forkhead associated (FHA) protein
MPTSLRIIEGPGKGTDYPMNPGDTIIGRGAKAQVKLASAEVSWEHAIITRLGEDWMIENLSAHGTQLNDQKISGRVRLRPKDRIRVTDDTVLRFESTEGPQVNVLANPWLVRGVIGALVLLVVGWGAVMLLRKPVPPDNWRYAFDSMFTWVQAETDARRMPSDVLALFKSARDSEIAATRTADQTDKTAQAFKVAAGRYEKLMLRIDGLEDTYHCMANAARNPRVLKQKLLASSSADTMDTDEFAAALEELVKARLDNCNSRAGLAK